MSKLPSMQTINSNILSNMLLQDPQAFLQYIKKYKKYTKVWVLGDCKSYLNWFSPPIQQLVILTGELDRKPTTELQSRFFGGKMPIGIPEDLALQIFEELKKYPIDHLDTCYYKDNLETFLRDRRWKPYCRSGNRNLIIKICEYFGLPQEIVDVVPEKGEAE